MIRVPIAANWKDVCLLIEVNPVHATLKYGDCYDFMDR